MSIEHGPFTSDEKFILVFLENHPDNDIYFHNVRITWNQFRWAKETMFKKWVELWHLKKEIFIPVDSCNRETFFTALYNSVRCADPTNAEKLKRFIY
jgi:hypothetical protein